MNMSYALIFNKIIIIVDDVIIELLSQIYVLKINPKYYS